ncbi:uncharacterized protein LOC143293052 [Babylonia areolata]|uniref:uncharacterized protein LOC143293052 n=1 Tax=Babylonia areolata TaxID=304850 RepID=UPI003FD4BB69
MRVTVWMTLLSTCLIGITVDSAIIRDYRAALKKNPDKTTPLDHERDAAGGGRNQGRLQRQRTRRKTFRPNPSRCCQIGYKVAKRKLSCDINVLEVVRKYNDLQRAKMKYNRPRKIVRRPSKISAKLSTKLGKCAITYPQFFEKCCKVKDQYYKRLAKCKKRPSRERRKCRQYVRRRFRIPKRKGSGGSGGGGGGGKKKQRRAKAKGARGRRKA